MLCSVFIQFNSVKQYQQLSFKINLNKWIALIWWIQKAKESMCLTTWRYINILSCITLMQKYLCLTQSVISLMSKPLSFNILLLKTQTNLITQKSIKTPKKVHHNFILEKCFLFKNQLSKY